MPMTIEELIARTQARIDDAATKMDAKRIRGDEALALFREMGEDCRELEEKIAGLKATLKEAEEELDG